MDLVVKYNVTSGKHNFKAASNIQVPLGRRFGGVLTEQQHFSPQKLIQQLRAKGLEVRPALHLLHHHVPSSLSTLPEI